MSCSERSATNDKMTESKSQTIIRTLDDIAKSHHSQIQQQGRTDDQGRNVAQQCYDNAEVKDENDSDINNNVARRRRGTASALIIAAAHKSGLTQSKVDRAKIDAILLRESANSEYMKQQRRRDDCVNAKIDQLRQKLEETKKEAISLLRQKQGFQSTKQEKSCVSSSSSKHERTQERQDNLQAQWKAQLNHASDTKLAKWSALASLPAPSTCVVVDMDSFYISCELLTKPHLRDIPCCVGSPSSIISTSNYKAREYGVRSAMGGWIAQTLVKELSHNTQQLIFLRSNFDLYREKSAQVMDVLRQYDPNLSSHSLDEAYMNLGPYLNLRIKHGLSHEEIQQKLTSDEVPNNRKKMSESVVKEPETDTVEKTKETDNRGETGIQHATHTSESASDASCTKSGSIDRFDLVDICNEEDNMDDNNSTDEDDERDAVEDESLRQTYITLTQQIIREMRSKVQQQTGGLTCSAGIGSNHMIAKIASDINKPDGQKYVASDRRSTLDFLHPLPIRRVPGIGRVMEKTLQAFGIDIVRHLYEQRGLLPILFKPVSADFLLRASVGLNSSAIANQGLGGEDDTGNANDEAKQHYQRKGIGRSRTLATLTDVNDMLLKLEEITTMVSNDMKQKGIRSRTFTVSVKLHTFDVFNKAKSLGAGRFTNDIQEMKDIAKELFQDIRQSHLSQGQQHEQQCHHQSKSKTHSNDPRQSALFHVRLLGVRCHNLVFDGDNDENDNEEHLAKNQLTIQSFLKKGTQHKLGDKISSKISEVKGSDQSRKRSLKDFLSGSSEGGQIPKTSNFSPNANTNDTVIMVEDCDEDSLLSKERRSIARDNRSERDKSVEVTPSALSKAPSKQRGSIAQATCEEVIELGENEQSITSTVYECPICQKILHNVHNNQDLNCHIDSCLNSKTIQQVVRETHKDGASKAKLEHSAKKKVSPGISSYFCSSQCLDTTNKKSASGDKSIQQNRIKKMKEFGWQKIQR